MTEETELFRVVETTGLQVVLSSNSTHSSNASHGADVELNDDTGRDFDHAVINDVVRSIQEIDSIEKVFSCDAGNCGDASECCQIELDERAGTFGGSSAVKELIGDVNRHRHDFAFTRIRGNCADTSHGSGAVFDDGTRILSCSTIEKVVVLVESHRVTTVFAS